MKGIEAIGHIYTTPGTMVRDKSWDIEDYIIVNSDGGIEDEQGIDFDPRHLGDGDWEIVTKPIKYETHIWLPHEPSLNLDYNENRQFLERLTDSSYYLDNESNGYNRKIKITVEEV